MSQPIDLMYVELQSRGEDDTARSIHAALNDIERDVERTTRAIELDVTKLTLSIEQQVKRLTGVIEREALKQRAALTQAFSDVGRNVDANFDVATRAVNTFAVESVSDLSSIDDSVSRTHGAIVRFSDDAERDFRRVQLSVDGFTRDTHSGLERVTDVTQKFTQLASSGFAQLGSTLGSVGSVFSSLFGVVQAVLIASLIPAIITLGGALFDLAGAAGLLLPAFASLVAVGGTLMLAFQGIGDAVSALASGDLEKIDEAMKSLSPSAQRFARELFALKDPLDSLKKTVQEAFFSQFTGDLTRLADVTIPVLKTGLGDVATALGKFGAEIIELLGEQDILDVMKDVFATTSRIIEKMTPIVSKLLGTLFGLTEAGLPHLEKLADYIGEGATKLTEFLGESLKSGSFNTFIEDAAKTFKDLVALTKSLGKLFGTIFGDAGDEGRSVIQTFTEIVDKLNAFYQSAEGQDQLQAIFDFVVLLANVFSKLTSVLTTVNRWVQQVATAIGTFITKIIEAVDAVGRFFSKLWQGVTDVGASVGNFFTRVGNFFSTIGQSIGDAWNSVTEFGGRILTFFQELPDKIIVFVQSLPERISTIFTAMFDRVTYAIGYGIGAVIMYFTTLPERTYNAIVGVISFVTSVFTQVWNTATTWTTNVINNVVSFFTQLPGRVYNAILQIIAYVTNVFTRTFNSAKSQTQSLVSSVTSILTQLPGKVFSILSSVPSKVKSALSSAITVATNIGRDIMRGIQRGIENGVGFVIDAAKRAASNILDGMMDALQIGSPSRLAERSIGKNITAGVAVGVEKGVPEVQRSINDATRSFLPSATNVFNAGQSAGQGPTNAVTFGQGAIQVNVSGAMSESDAQAVGAGIGRGISSTLARQSVRTQLRTV